MIPNPFRLTLIISVFGPYCYEDAVGKCWSKGYVAASGGGSRRGRGVCTDFETAFSFEEDRV